jgi:transcriptional regulator with XRE-family HTH domain
MSSEITLDRRDTVTAFRTRLAKAMQWAGTNRSQLARRVGIDRSTMSQLLSPDNDRLPRADTVAAIAVALQVSLDWLLGLSQDEMLGAGILEQSLQIQPRQRSPVDEDLVRWHAEAVGYKIRYVPTNIPDQVKIPEVIAHEYDRERTPEQGQAIVRARDRLDYVRRPETDIEICMPIQGLLEFARGEGIWHGLTAAVREAQLGHIARLTAELYPGMRWFLFDGLSLHSVPVTIFGPLRVAIYIGQMYFVFNTTEHIRVLTRHFDDLIRHAVVQSHELSRFAADLHHQVRETGTARPTRQMVPA